MAIPRATRGVLLVAFLGLFSALAVATGLARLPRRSLPAPEAWAALEQHDPERAAEIFRQQLRAHPDDPVLHFGVASAAYALGRTGSALTSLKKAVDLDPEYAEALSMLGPVAYQRGETDLAIRSAEKALALRPRDRRLRAMLDQWTRESSVHNSYVEKSSGHFRVLYEGGTQQHIGNHVTEVLERGYASIGRTLGSYPSDTVTVILYTNREFQDITRSPSWAAGGYDGRIRVSVGGTLSPLELDRVVTHELVHAMVASAASRRVPAWLNEGLACYLESNNRSWAPAVIRSAPAVVPLENLVNGFGGLDEQSALVAYAESEIAAEILGSLLHGNLGAFLQTVGSGSTVDQALLTFQVQPDAFHGEWRRRVGLR